MSNPKRWVPHAGIQELLPLTAKACFFSAVDRATGCHQVPMGKDAVDISAFYTNFEHFEFFTLSVGLRHAPATYHCPINRIFADRLDNDLLFYVDNAIICCESYEEDLCLLDLILTHPRFWLQIPAKQVPALPVLRPQPRPHPLP